MTAVASPRPAVSICVPTYNGAAYLSVCLDSILGQTFADFEVVAVDDRSCDDTVDILKRYSRMDRRLRIWENPGNLGLVGNWNRCIEQARGRWIKFVFQDDWIVPDCVRIMVEEAISGQAVLAVCRRRFSFESVSEGFRGRYPDVGQEVSPESIWPGRRSISAEALCNAVLDHGVTNFIGEPTATLIDRDAITQFGVFNRKLIQLCDIEYWLRVGVNRGIHYIPDTLAYCRIHEGSTTASNFARQRFRGDVVDPLLIKCEFSYNPDYQILRDVARSRGIDLEADFISASVLEQRWGKEHANPGWREVLAMEPRVRMPWQLRMRRLVRNLLEAI